MINPPDAPQSAPVPRSSSPQKPSVRSFLARFGAEAGLLLLCFFLFFWRLGSVPLIDYDEALYVSCARQMAASGDWVTPRLNTRLPERAGETRIAFFEKPILVYWASAGAMRLLGLHLWAARLPVAFASLLTTFCVYLAGRNWFGRRAALLSGLVYATAPMTLIDARQMTTDALLVLWLTVAMLCFWQAQEEGRRGKGKGESNKIKDKEAKNIAPFPFSLFPFPFLPLPSLFWLMCGLAVLTKGVVGLLLPFLIIGVYLLLDRGFVRVRLRRTAQPRLRIGIQMRPLRVLWTGIARLRPVSGLLLFGLIAAPWHVLIALRPDLDAQGRTWVQEYLLRQHIGRFRGLDAVHNQPIFTFFIYFLLGFFPWACFAPAAFRAAKRRFHHRDTEAQRDSQRREGQGGEEGQATERQRGDSSLIPHPASFLLTWFWTIFVFFSLGAAKLPTYITPAYPAAALLLGRWLDQALAKKRGENHGENVGLENGSGQNKQEKNTGEATAEVIETTSGETTETTAGQAQIGRALRRGTLTACGVGALLLIGALAAPDRTTTGVPIPADLIRFGMHVALLFTLGSGGAWFCFRQAETNLSSGGLRAYGKEARTGTWRERGIGALALMMVLAIGVIATEGYAAVRNSVLGPYQQLAAAASPDARAGLPVLFYAITPRRPSMLFYADYAPFEHKETPFLPFLAHCLTPAQRYADVIMTGKAYENIVFPEVQKLPGASIQVLQKRGPADGWLLTRVFVPASYKPPPLPRHKVTLWETVSY